MNLQLKGLKALVTGSTSGIGQEIAQQLYREGCSVIVTGRGQATLRNYEQGEALDEKPELLALQCDFTEDKQISDLVHTVESYWGYLDILVCNVGSGRSVPPLQETREEWERMIELNLYTVTSAVQRFLPLIKKSTHASIVCIASICGIESLDAPTTYSVAKAGVISLVADWAQSLGELGIRINAVSPGNVWFPGSVWDLKMKENPGLVEKMINEQVPLKRLAKASEIADAVTYLASPRASFITGTNLVVDGGQTRTI